MDEMTWYIALATFAIGSLTTWIVFRFRYSDRSIVQTDENILNLIYENANEFIALFEVDEAKQLRIMKLPVRFLNSIEENTTFKRSEVVGKTITWLYDEVLKLNEEEKAQRLEQIDKALNSGSITTYEEYYKNPDGTRGWSVSTFVPLKADGKLKHVLFSSKDITSNIKIKKELEEKTLELESLTDNIPGLLFRLKTDEEFELQYLSGNSERYLGISREEIREHKLRGRDVLPEEFVVKSRAYIAELVASNSSGEMKLPIVYQGVKRWVNARFKPTILPSGELVVDGLLFDITKEVEIQEQYQLAIESAEEAVLDWHVDKGLLYVNLFFTKIMNLQEEVSEVSFESFFNKIYPEDKSRAIAQMQQLFEGKAKQTLFDFRVSKSKDAYKWVKLMAKVYSHDSAGNPDRIIGTMIDIDKQKKNEIRLSALMANVPGMVYQTSLLKGYELLYVSDGCFQLTGYEASYFLKNSRSIYSLIKEPYLEEIRENIKTAISNGKPYSLFYEIDTADGPKWVYDRGQETEKGIIEGVVMDITERIKSEEMILQTIIETEDRERERIAKELHDSLGQKLTTASLSFNAMKNEKIDVDERMSRLENGLKHLQDSINETRSIAHNLVPRGIEAFGLIPSLQGLIAEVNAASPSAITFYTNIETEDFNGTLAVHLYRMAQEGLNNALKYAKAKTIALQLMQYNDVLMLSIEDDGQGFELAKLSKQEQFGLDSIRHRAQIFNGEVTIDSSLNRGTVLSIEIPMDTVENK